MDEKKLQSKEDDIMKMAKVYCLSKDKVIFVSYWDLGGDKLYHATHHMHLSSDAVYVLVFDMEDMGKNDKRQSKLGKCNNIQQRINPVCMRTAIA